MAPGEMEVEPLSVDDMKLENIDLIKGVQVPLHGVAVRLRDNVNTKLELEDDGSVTVSIHDGKKTVLKVITAANVACYETAEAARMAKEMDGRSAEKKSKTSGSSVEQGAKGSSGRGRKKDKSS